MYLAKRISITIGLKQEDNEYASDIIHLYNVCEDKEHFKEIFKRFEEIITDTVNKFYKMLEKEGNNGVL